MQRSILFTLLIIICLAGLTNCGKRTPKPEEPDTPETVFVGSFAGTLYALDAQTGTRKWDLPLENLFATGPAYAKGVVYIGSAEKLVAIDAITGKQKWAITLGNRDRLGYIWSIPTVVNDIAYVSVRGDANKLVAVDVKNVSILWSYSLQSMNPVTPTVSDGIVCVGATGKLVALDALTGDLKWKAEDYRWQPTNSSIVDGTVYTNCGYRFYAHDLSTGRQKWVSVFEAIGCPTIEGDYIYLKGDGVFVVDRHTGKYLRSFNFLRDGRANPVVQNGTVYLGSGGIYSLGETYAFHAVNMPSATRKWRQPTTDVIDSSPTAAGDFVYAGAIGPVSKFVAFDTKSGEIKWITPLPGSLNFTPACVVSKKGVVYHASDSGDQQ